MGIASIMRCKQILLLISGSNKRDALVELLQGEIHESFPASILRTHPSVTIIADEAAIGDLIVHHT
ncbi:Glucosamine-6-phosphate deaminase [compost metagenome]